MNPYYGSVVDRSALGASGEPFVMDVERGKIAEFARAVQSGNPAYFAEERPVIPPTFLVAAAFWQTGESDPWEKVRMDPGRGLHAEQEFVFHGPPPRAGTRLTGRSRIVEITDKPGRRGGHLAFVTMLTEFTDETGRVVAESRRTGVEVERPPEQE